MRAPTLSAWRAADGERPATFASRGAAILGNALRSTALRSNAFCITAAFMLILHGCKSANTLSPVSETRLLLDTVCTITIYEPQDRRILTEALDQCEMYENLLSVTKEDSDVWRVNHAGGVPVTVSPFTAEVIKAGLEFGELSSGRFDITIGRLSALWDFKGDPSVPSGKELAAAVSTVDYRKVEVTGDVVRLADPDTRLDPGGIAKGYIADRLAGFIRECGVKSAVIDLGGNVIVVGTKPDKTLWRVGVRKPFGRNGELLGTITTGESSVVTSGIYERLFESDGVMYHHILDPDSGMPAESDVFSATVLSESSMTGDALSTMLVLAGSERAAELIDGAPGVTGALLLLADGAVLEFGDVVFDRAGS